MILSPFNTLHIIMLIAPFAFTFLLWLTLRKRSEKARRNVLLIISAFNMALYWVYKGVLSVDADFLVCAGLDKFNWLNELPIQLCNINLFLIPIGLWTKKKPILGFSFFLGSVGALAALLFPEPAFRNCSVFLFRMIGYYGTHILICASCLSLMTLGFYRPILRDTPGILAAFLVLSLAAHGVNTLLRMGACEAANYFFTYGADISVLNLCWKLIPIPYLYELPLFAVLLAYIALVCLIYKLVKGKEKIKA